MLNFRNRFSCCYLFSYRIFTSYNVPYNTTNSFPVPYTPIFYLVDIKNYKKRSWNRGWQHNTLNLELLANNRKILVTFRWIVLEIPRVTTRCISTEYLSPILGICKYRAEWKNFLMSDLAGNFTHHKSTAKELRELLNMTDEDKPLNFVTLYDFLHCRKVMKVLLKPCSSNNVFYFHSI